MGPLDQARDSLVQAERSLEQAERTGRDETAIEGCRKEVVSALRTLRAMHETIKLILGAPLCSKLSVAAFSYLTAVYLIALP
jgi:Mg2+ and Co2+ transporter CorA